MGEEAYREKSLSLSPIRVFILCVILGSFFSVWLGSSEPWWRPKEWAVFILGAGWLGLRGLARVGSRIGDGFTSLPLSILMTYLAIQFSIQQILPIIMASGRYSVSPWPWMAFFQVILAYIWMRDVSNLCNQEDWKWVLRLLGKIAVILSILMLLQLAERDPLLHLIQSSGKAVKWLHPNHVVGLMGNPFQAGAVLSVLIPVLVRLKWRLALLLSLAALYVTQSHGAWIACAIGVGVVAYLQGWKRCLIAWTSLCMMGAFYLLVIKHFQPLQDLSDQIDIWSKSLAHFSKHPLLGVGLGNYKLLGIQTVGESAVRWAHNEYIQILIELGMVGLTLFAVWMRELINRMKSVDPAWAGVLASIAILSLVGIPLHMAPTLVVSALATSHAYKA